MIERVVLAPDLRTRLVTEAEAAFPSECCGLIEGVREENLVRVRAVHPTRNLASHPDRFEIDPAAHIALLRRLRGTGRDIVGCYHSHPNGAAEPSAWDTNGAFDENFLWLVVAITGVAPPWPYWERARPWASQRIPALHHPTTPGDGRGPGESSSHTNPPFEANLAAFVFDGDGPRELQICAAAA